VKLWRYYNLRKESTSNMPYDPISPSTGALPEKDTRRHPTPGLPEETGIELSNEDQELADRLEVFVTGPEYTPFLSEDSQQGISSSERTT
jgi:hypothetical protein